LSPASGDAQPRASDRRGERRRDAADFLTQVGSCSTCRI
jgi:hypothetical protein